MGALIGHKPYAPVKCFWVEPAGKWIARVLLEGDGQVWQTIGRFDTEAEAEACTRKAWDTQKLFSSSTSKAYVLPSGEEVTSGELPPGAMFDAYWLHDQIPMEDGITLMVVLPNGVHWSPDSRAGNCGSKDDNEHCCWLRRGDPRTGMIHVDKGKDGEKTCVAGGGSIASMPVESNHHYHGYLHRGWLTAG